MTPRPAVRPLSPLACMCILARFRHFRDLHFPARDALALARADVGRMW